MMEASKRKTNFSAAENAFLTELYEEYKEVLDDNHRDANTNNKKNEAWGDIVRRHNSRFPFVSRGKDDLRSKLGKLKSGAREVLLEKKKSLRKTGGGRDEVPPPNEAVQKILDLCSDTPSFQGLEGVDSFPEGMHYTAMIKFLHTLIFFFYTYYSQHELDHGRYFCCYGV